MLPQSLFSVSPPVTESGALPAQPEVNDSISMGGEGRFGKVWNLKGLGRGKKERRLQRRSYLCWLERRWHMKANRDKTPNILKRTEVGLSRIEWENPLHALHCFMLLHGLECPTQIQRATVFWILCKCGKILKSFDVRMYSPPISTRVYRWWFLEISYLIGLEWILRYF